MEVTGHPSTKKRYVGGFYFFEIKKSSLFNDLSHSLASVCSLSTLIRMIANGCPKGVAAGASEGRMQVVGISPLKTNV